jgi:hypothetical protein
VKIEKQRGPCSRSPGAWAFFRAVGPLNAGAAAFLPLALLLAGATCRRNSSAELPLSVQAAEVRAGIREAIAVEATLLRDADLESLGALEGLTALLCDHPDSRFSAAGISTLGRLPNLKHLRIRGHGIDDAAVAELVNIQSLRILNLPHAEFTDAGAKQLSNLPILKQLRIGSPHISRAGIEALAALPALRQLHTIDIPIDDEELRILAGVKHLESLYIDGGTFSDAAADELFRARPDLHVHFDQQHHDRDPHRHSHR